MTLPSQVSPPVGIFKPILFTALAVLVVDQITKYFARVYLAGVVTHPVINGIFHLTLVYNTGAAFGFLKGASYFFMAVSMACIVLIFVLLSGKTRLAEILALNIHQKLVRISLGLILGGAVGNLVDRLRYSAVVDFLDFRIWPVFNAADSAITIGALLILFEVLYKSSKE